jgi:hypothetical protein
MTDSFHKVLQQRKQWFSLMEEAHSALWWIQAGHIPTPEEARQRLETLPQFGSAAKAFTFKHAFPSNLVVIEQGNGI